jgi:hypothetical protein
LTLKERNGDVTPIEKTRVAKSFILTDALSSGAMLVIFGYPRPRIATLQE